jgi:hypothetical protein
MKGMTTSDDVAALEQWAAQLRQLRREWRQKLGNPSERLLLRASIREQARYLACARAVKIRNLGAEAERKGQSQESRDGDLSRGKREKAG